jgi:protein SCO1
VNCSRNPDLKLIKNPLSALQFSFALAIFVIVTLFNCPLFAQNPDSSIQNTIPKLSDAPANPALSDSGELGIDEKLGNFVPIDVPFIDETGSPVLLGDVIKGPTILSIVFYKCPNACDFLLSGIGGVLRSYADNPGQEPNLVTLTIDESETPADAIKAKNIAFSFIQKPFPPGHWHFLTGPQGSIKKVTDAVGFHFVKKGDDFEHPVGLIILSPKGEIVRYILGTGFLPLDLKMSLLQASSGVVRPTIYRMLRFCFSYDPKNNRFVFNLLRVSATVIFVFIGVFVLYLVVSGKRRHRKKVEND